MPSATGMKSPGGMSPRRRVLPAQQRLGALDPLALQRVLGLEVQEELVGDLQRPAQVAEHGQPVRRGGVLLGLEDHGLALERLRGVHRDVGVAEQVLGLGAVPRRQRDAHAGLDVEDDVVDVERLVQRRAQPLGDELGLADAVDGREQDGELVAAEPGDRVAVAEHRLHARARPGRGACRRRCGRACR